MIPRPIFDYARGENIFGSLIFPVPMVNNLSIHVN